METSTTPKTSQSKRRSLRPSPSSSFKSPLITPEEKKISSQFENASLEDMKKAILELWQENEDLKKAIHELEEQGYEESQLKWYIDKLHEYNEIKDVAQMVMGRIAVLEQKTVREVHEDFGMKDED
ncbi:DNA repair protein SWI5 homolog [Argiope bruennichi]|uniref:DNA repair protein SWI5 homolog n=1 Tax=Argiope bruennichi TaxID=94029 RepID=A0A8T0E9U1_ARGBR|nr:DNA repair protein SWI5 homolog [Argiope bruennichi]KAF8767221.1 DNA repair protein SWI5 like protein [Argiope bruennichi]